MFNEMQAYLMFTRDPMFFTPGQAGLTPARLAELQTRFLPFMPSELRPHDLLASYQGAAKRPTSRRPLISQKLHIVTIPIVKVDRDSANKSCLITIS